MAVGPKAELVPSWVSLYSCTNSCLGKEAAAQRDGALLKLVLSSERMCIELWPQLKSPGGWCPEG